MGEIITKQQAEKLVKMGKAKIEDTTVSTDREDRKLVPVTRYDAQRVDHYEIRAR